MSHVQEGAQRQPTRIDVASVSAAALALCLWSGTAPAIKIAVTHIDSLTAGLLRSALAGMLAACAIMVLRLRPPTGASQVGLVILSGVTSFAIWPAMLSIGVSGTTAGHAGLVMALLPVLTVLFGQLLRRRVPGAMWWVGALLALGAAALLMLGRGMRFAPVTNGPGLLGDLTVLVGCAVCAVGYVAGGRLSSQLGALPTTLWGLIAATFLTLPMVSLLAPRTDWGAVPVSAWLAVAFLTVFSSLLGYMLWFFALGRGGVHRIGSLQLAMPAMTLVVATVVLGERLGAWSMVAAGLLIWGTVIAHRHA